MGSMIRFYTFSFIALRPYKEIDGKTGSVLLAATATSTPFWRQLGATGARHTAALLLLMLVVRAQIACCGGGGWLLPSTSVSWPDFKKLNLKKIIN
jgi:hypothetical protein